VLTLHRLQVYQKALAFGAGADELSASWGRRHAIVDHFRRASESIVLNLAEAARLRSAPDKTRTLDYALGSSLECAACLEIALIKGRISQARSFEEKQRIVEITRMLIGLRKAWLQGVMSEEASPYDAKPSADGMEVHFHHETLDVYKVGLDFMRWFLGLPGVGDLPDRWCREIDKSGTSVVLNVAEGNGRYSELDHRRFVEVAAGSAVKARVYLDLYAQKAVPGGLDLAPGTELLGRILAMLSGF